MILEEGVRVLPVFENSKDLSLWGLRPGPFESEGRGEYGDLTWPSSPRTWSFIEN